MIRRYVLVAASITVFVSLVAIACRAIDPSSAGLGRAHLIDLTHAFDETTIYWPTTAGFVLESDFEGYTAQGYYYEANSFHAAEHGGTHIDAPVHFADGRRSVDQIPLEQLVSDAVVIDVSAECDEDRDYQIDVDDLEMWEADHGSIADGTIVLLRTGFGRFWPDKTRYMGTTERGEAGVRKLRFPGLHPDAARWLVSHRHIAAIGIDTLSIDFGQSTLFESHRVLFDRNVPAFENLANLDRLPDKGFTIIALPMKIRGGSGAPLRVIAMVP